MAAYRPGQAGTGVAGATISTPEAQVIPRPGRYEIDTSCSAVTFRTRHLFGLAPVRGSFTIRAGTIDVAEPLADSSVHVHIDPASFRTGNGQRDNNVRSERLLDADRYPVITFRSEGVDGPALTGTLTVRNVTLPVPLSIEPTAVRARWFNARASARIDRAEFGVTAYRGLAGRYLDMTIKVRCVRNEMLAKADERRRARQARRARRRPTAAAPQASTKGRPAPGAARSTPDMEAAT